MDRRTVLAFVLCFGVLMAFQLYQAQNMPKRPGHLQPTQAPSAPAGTRPSPVTQPAAPQAPPAAGVPANLQLPPAALPAFSAEAKTATHDLEHLELSYRSRGGVIDRFILKDYKDVDAKTPLDLLTAFAQPTFGLNLEVDGQSLADVDWQLTESADALLFRRPLGPDLWVEKQIVPRADGRSVSVEIRFVNNGPERTIAYSLFVADAIKAEEPVSQELCSGIAGLQGDGETELEEEQASGLPTRAQGKGEEFVGNTAFGGMSSKYFAMVLVPDAAIRSELVLELWQVQGHFDKDKTQEAVSANASYSARKLTLPAMATTSHAYTLFGGAKHISNVEPLNIPSLKKLSDVTSIIPLTSTLTVIFIKLMHAFHAVCGSYGVAIILLTLLVRGALHPLSKAQTRSSVKMQKLAPKVKVIREKFKDKTSREHMQKMNAEIMQLYKDNGASPVAGCLPVVLQLPVFYGLYNALAYAVELRQIDFLWITDLSKPDRLLAFDFQVPWPMEPYLNVLPLLMVVTMVMQQMFTPKPEDPQQQQQAKVMRFVMVFFGLLFYTMPSGLVLYFVTSSTVATLEMRWIRSQIEKEELNPPPPAPAKKKAGDVGPRNKKGKPSRKKAF